MSDSDSDDMPPLEDMRPQFFDTEIGRHPPVKTAHGGAISGNDNREVIMKKTDTSEILNPEARGYGTRAPVLVPCARAREI